MASTVLMGDTSGSITLTVPAVAGSNTITLPANTGTVITTASSGQVIPFGALPTGSVLQVVSIANSTGYSGTSGAEVYTGMSANITPKYSTSRILIIYQLSAGVSTASTNAAYQLLLRRGTTTAGTLLARARCGAYTGDAAESYASMILASFDNPSTTSAVTYGVFENNIDGTNTWYLNSNSGISNLTLMEIAA